MHTRRCSTEAGRTTYNRRMHIGETPFAIIKAILDVVRRFLLRGLDKVRTEWCWVCTAYNLKKPDRRGGSPARKLYEPAIKLQG